VSVDHFSVIPRVQERSERRRKAGVSGRSLGVITLHAGTAATCKDLQLRANNHTCAGLEQVAQLLNLIPAYANSIIQSNPLPNKQTQGAGVPGRNWPSMALELPTQCG
jgi:hypothetical protein